MKGKGKEEKRIGRTDKEVGEKRLVGEDDWKSFFFFEKKDLDDKKKLINKRNPNIPTL